jgi:hypothetical protein
MGRELRPSVAKHPMTGRFRLLVILALRIWYADGVSPWRYCLLECPTEIIARGCGFLYSANESAEFPECCGGFKVSILMRRR